MNTELLEALTILEKEKEISKETLEAAGMISRFLALLSSMYKKDYENKLFTEE